MRWKGDKLNLRALSGNNREQLDCDDLTILCNRYPEKAMQELAKMGYARFLAMYYKVSGVKARLG